MFNKRSVSPDHEHSYLPLQNNATRTVFEPFTPDLNWIEKHSEAMIELYDNVNQLYRMVEYMYLFCKCGDSLMSEIPKRKLDDKKDT